MQVNLRKATKADLPQVFDLIRELAEYEKAPEEVTITLEEMERDGFGDHPLYWILVAEKEREIIGISFYYVRYSTWKGKCLYLEDIVVREEFRSQGIGKNLFEATIKEAKQMKAKQMVWQVLDWNYPAISFYQKYNAELDPEWINGKIRFE